MSPLPTEAVVLAALRDLPADSFLRQYCRWAGSNTSAPIVYHVNAGLSLLAVCAADAFSVEYAGRFRFIWWGMIVGEHGDSFKTTAVNYAEDLLRRVAPQRVGADAGSWEGLVESLAEPWSRQLIFHGEFGSWLAKTSGRGYLSPMREQYLKLWDCREVGRRLARTGTVIAEPRVSILAAANPSELERHTDENDYNNGFMSRWCILGGKRERAPITLPGGRGHDLYLWLVDRLTDIHEITPTTWVGLDDDALALFEQWGTWAADHRDKVPRLLVGTLARSNALIIRAAALLSLDFGEAGRVGTWRIGAPAMRFAIRLAGWHLQSLETLIGSICATTYQRNRRAVLDVVPEDGTSVPRSLLARRTRLSPRDLRDVLEGLQEERTVFMAEGGDGAEAWYARAVVRNAGAREAAAASETATPPAKKDPE